MADNVAFIDPIDSYAEQGAPATQVRGYWESVLYRLRHDCVTLASA